VESQLLLFEIDVVNCGIFRLELGKSWVGSKEVRIFNKFIKSLTCGAFPFVASLDEEDYVIEKEIEKEGDDLLAFFKFLDKVSLSFTLVVELINDIGNVVLEFKLQQVILTVEKPDPLIKSEPGLAGLDLCGVFNEVVEDFKRGFSNCYLGVVSNWDCDKIYKFALNVEGVKLGMVAHISPFIFQDLYRIEGLRMNNSTNEIVHRHHSGSEESVLFFVGNFSVDCSDESTHGNIVEILIGKLEEVFVVSEHFGGHKETISSLVNEMLVVEELNEIYEVGADLLPFIILVQEGNHGDNNDSDDVSMAEELRIPGGLLNKDPVKGSEKGLVGLEDIEDFLEVTFNGLLVESEADIPFVLLNSFKHFSEPDFGILTVIVISEVLVWVVDHEEAAPARLEDFIINLV